MSTMRIVSLVPSLTELLFHLGLEDQIVGRTKFCIHPKHKVRSAAKIGGTKNVHIDKVLALSPDIIIANKEENTKVDIEELQKHSSVLLTEIADYGTALEAILTIGKETNKKAEAELLIEEIELRFRDLKQGEAQSVCYLIWQKPYMSIGHDTFIHDMLAKCGYQNICGDQTRYPILSIKEIRDKQPDLVFLSSEPFPFKQKHIDELQESLPSTKILLVDGEYFSWYGNRMLDAVDYFVELQKETVV